MAGNQYQMYEKVLTPIIIKGMNALQMEMSLTPLLIREILVCG